MTHWPQVLSIALTNGEAIQVCTDETPAVSRFQLPSPTSRMLARSPDGRRFLLQDFKGSQIEGPIFTWDTVAGRTDAELGVAPAYTAAVYSPDGRYVACVSYSSSAVIWDLNGRRQRSVLRGHRWYLFCISFSPDGRLVATGSWDGTARLWDAATGQLVAVLKGHRSGVPRVQFSTDGRTLITVGHDAAIGFWNVAAGREMLRLDGIYQSVTGYGNFGPPRFSSDDRALLFGPFVEPSESGAQEAGWRYVLTPIPTLAEVEAAEGTAQGNVR